MRRLLNKKTLIISAISVAIAASAYAVWHKPAPISNTASVKRMTLQKSVTAVGHIVPTHIVTVKSPLSGTVGSLMHNNGDYVKKGETLIRVKPNPTPQQLAQALELVARDKAALHSDKQQLQNFQQLLDYNIIAKNYDQLVRAQQAVKQDQSTLAFDQQNLDLLQKGQTKINGQLVKNTITSPIDGYILSRNVDIGDSVVSLNDMQAATPLFVIANMHDLQFKGTVDETDANQLQTGMPAEVEVAALPNKVINGTINLLALQSEQQNEVDNPTISSASSSTTPFNVGFEIQINHLKIPAKATLRSGFSATAKVVLQQAKDALVIPETAVHFDHDKAYVNKVVKGHKTERTLIKTGLSDGLNIQVLSGLKLGDTIALAQADHA